MIMSYRPRFSQLVDRFGEISAWQHLVEIERAAGLEPQSLVIDPEARLARALCAQDTHQGTDLQRAA